MTIPLVDLSDFMAGHEGLKKSFVQQLGKAYGGSDLWPLKIMGLLPSGWQIFIRRCRIFFHFHPVKRAYKNYPGWCPGEAVLSLERTSGLSILFFLPPKSGKNIRK